MDRNVKVGFVFYKIGLIIVVGCLLGIIFEIVKGNNPYFEIYKMILFYGIPCGYFIREMFRK